MNEQFTKQAEEMMASMKNMQVPENVQALAEDAVTRGREAYDRVSEATKENTKAMEEVTTVATANAKSMNERMLDLMTANTSAAFDAAEAMIKSRTLPEAARIQADYMQQAMTQATEQTRELYELGSNATRETVEVVSAAASKNMEAVKPA